MTTHDTSQASKGRSPPTGHRIHRQRPRRAILRERWHTRPGQPARRHPLSNNVAGRRCSAAGWFRGLWICSSSSPAGRGVSSRPTFAELSAEPGEPTLITGSRRVGRRATGHQGPRHCPRWHDPDAVQTFLDRVAQRIALRGSHDWLATACLTSPVTSNTRASHQRGTGLRRWRLTGQNTRRLPSILASDTVDVSRTRQQTATWLSVRSRRSGTPRPPTATKPTVPKPGD